MSYFETHLRNLDETDIDYLYKESTRLAKRMGGSCSFLYIEPLISIRIFPPEKSEGPDNTSVLLFEKS